MRYFLQKVKVLYSGEIKEYVLLTTNQSGCFSFEKMCGEELISSKEITEEEAIKFCGTIAIKGE